LVDVLLLDSILETEASWLERDFEEVKTIVIAMNGDKAPSLDGFSMVFFHAC
jgi:hypothetical protein